MAKQTRVKIQKELLVAKQNVYMIQKRNCLSILLELGGKGGEIQRCVNSRGRTVEGTCSDSHTIQKNDTESKKEHSEEHFSGGCKYSYHHCQYTTPGEGTAK